MILMLSGPAGAAELSIPTVIDRSAPITGTFRTSPQATGRGTLTVEWTDILDRRVDVREIPVSLTDETEIRFPLDATRAVAMVNTVTAKLVLTGTRANGKPDHREETAATRFIARPPDRDWWDYAILMWHPHTAEQFAALTAFGINAGQFSGRAPQPPDFLLQNDLRGYAENIATDFYSEYHRYRPDRIPHWSYLQAKQLYRADPTSKEGFKRHPSFSDPAWQQAIHDRLVESTRALSPYRPVFYDLGDESGIADLAAFWDFDFSDQSLTEMRAWLKARYGTLAALNAQWGSRFTRWDLVTPDTTAEAMHRTDENYSAWSDHKEWMDVSYERALKMGVDAVRSIDRDAYVAIAGAQMPGWGGYDYARLSGVLTAIEPYDIGNNIEILHSLNPSLPFVTTAFARGPWEKHRIWYELLHGARGHIIWDEKNEFSSGDRGAEAAPYYKEIADGLGALLARSRPRWAPMGIHYSQASMRVEWMLAQRPKGDKWIDRTSATERLDSDFLRLRESWVKLVEDEGLQARFVAYDGVERGELLARGYRVLVLPRSSALSDGEAGEIRAFVEQGGVVIADGEPGAFDEHARRRRRPALAGLAVTRMDALAYNQERLVGKDGPQREALRAILDKAGVAPRFEVLDELGRRAAGVETHVFQNGGVTLVALLSNPELRVDELGPPEFKSNQRFEKRRELRLRLPGEWNAQDVRRAKALGRTKSIAVTLDPYEPEILAIAAEPLPSFRLSAPARAARGGTARLAILYDRPGPEARPVLHIEVTDPSGKVARHYSGNVRNGWKTIPFAYNDAPGRWTVRARDILSGQESMTAIELY